MTDFMDGFAPASNYYNAENGHDVKLLGWDAVKKDGSFTGNFDSLDDARGPDGPDAPGGR